MTNTIFYTIMALNLKVLFTILNHSGGSNEFEIIALLIISITLTLALG
jgi:hypothetical protein